MDELLKRLADAGCDIEGALKICGGLESLYLKLLGKFINKDYLDLLGAAYQERNVRDLFYQSHTLKGVYLSLGFTHLYELNNPLLEACRNESDDVFDKFPVDEWVSTLVEAHNSIADIIREEISI